MPIPSVLGGVLAPSDFDTFTQTNHTNHIKPACCCRTLVAVVQNTSGSRPFTSKDDMPVRVWRYALICGLLTSWFSQSERTPSRADEVVDDTVVADEDRSASAADDSDSATDAVKSVGQSAKKQVPLDPALELADPRTYRLKVMIRIEAPEAPVKNVIAIGPIPMDWPEQSVRLLNQKLSPTSKCSETVLKGQAAILRFQVPQIPKGGAAFVERLYEITRYRTRFLLEGEGLRMARGVPAELKDQVTGEPPGMEIKNPKMIELAESLRSSSNGLGPWETVKTFWSWTRDNVKFENGDFRGALYAVENRCGDCEEMSALFVGLCRLSGIPARTVWVESQQTGHDYPEFYLLDQQGKGHWIPAQVVGPPWFGEITEYRPIFQKGDRFYDPFQKTYVRYVPQTVRGYEGKIPPKVEFRHEVIADSDINGPSYSNSK